MTSPGGVIATVYVDVLPTVRDFSRQLRQQLRASSRQLRGIDRELEPVTRALSLIGRTATGIVPGIRLARTSLITLGGHAVVGGLLSAAGAASTLSGALGAVPALGVAAASGVGALTVGLFGVEDALKKFAKGEEAFNEKVKDLSTNAQAALGVLSSMRGEITAFRNAVQDRLFAGLDVVGRGLLETFLPLLTDHFGALADVVNLSARDLAEFVQTAQTLADLDVVTSNVESSFQLLHLAVLPAASAIRDIVTIGSQFLPIIAGEIVVVATEFSRWIAQMRATGQLREFIQNGVDALRQLFDILGNVGRSVRAILGAAEESGNGLLDTLQLLTDRAADFLETTRAQEGIGSFLDSAREAGAALLPVLLSLGDLLFNHVVPALEVIAKAVGPAVAAFFTGLGDALDVARPGIETFASGFASFITALIPVLPLLGQLLGQLGTLVGLLADKLGPVIAEIATALANILLPILEAITGFILVVSPEFLKLAVVIGVVIAAVSGLITVIRGVLAVAALFSAATELMAKGMLRTQGAATGLVGFLSGPWGIALGLATIALGLFLSTTDGAAQEQQRLKNVASELNDVIREQNGVINENVRAKAAQQLEDEGILRVAEGLGISVDDVTDAYLQQGDALDQVRQRLQAMIDAGGGVFEGETDILLAQALLDRLNALANAREADAEATARETAATNAGIHPKQAYAAAVDAATFALNALQDMQNRVVQQQLEAINSEVAYFNQLERTNAELTEGSKTLDVHTQEGRDNLLSITQLVQAGVQRINDLRQQNAATAEVTAQTEQMQNQLLDMIQPFFATRDAARAYLIQLGLIPDVITTIVNIVVPNISGIINQFRDRIVAGVTGRAHGGPVRAGEWTVVGEEGPELVRWGRSARVFSNDESERMASDVGQLDMMTRGSSSYRATDAGTTPQTIQVNDQITMQPSISVYLDGREIKNVVRVELDARDRQLQRLITTHAGTRR